MKYIKFLILLLFLTLNVSSYAQYDGYKLNADGSYAVGGCYDGYKLNADGSYAVGGAYNGCRCNCYTRVFTKWYKWNA